MSEICERNSSGERLYIECIGAKCNIRGMIRWEPEWVAVMFEQLMDKVVESEVSDE